MKWDKTGLWLRALFGILPFTYTLLDSVVVVVVVVVVDDDVVVVDGGMSTIGKFKKNNGAAD